jgi:catechol 2,3-dioxygenase-like lactoylglutathione lyase family enzyme
MTAQHTPELEPALVPELLVTSIGRSIDFWCGLCGFELRYSRPEERFAYIALGSAHLMLEEIGAGRNWITAPLDAPLGRGINLQISVADAAATGAALVSGGVELFMQPETKWYRTGDREVGVLQFLVTDPDGYLIRFQSSIGRREIRAQERDS